MNIVIAIIATVGLSDLSRRAPPPVELPPAGGWFVDPVFGTRILRVTDEDDGTLCSHAYAYWPAFNADSTRLLVNCDGRHLLHRFDGATVTADGALEGADGPRLQVEGASWSATDPDVLWALDDGGTRLWRVDVSMRGAAGYTLVRDFAGLFPYAFEAWQLHVAGDRLFTFHSRSPSGAKLDAAVFDADTGEVFLFDRGAFLIDETKIDKLGRVVMVDGSFENPGFKLWWFREGIVDDFGWNATDRPGGHVDMGATGIVNSDNWETGLLMRDYGAPHAAHNILRYLRDDGSANWTLSDHVSLRADDERWALVSTYVGDGSYQPFEDEIFLVRTDGSGFQRLAHTRSTRADYYAYPRAVIDRSGRWVVFASDLGSSSRVDVLILEIPAGTGPVPEDTPPAPDPDPGPDPSPPSLPLPPTQQYLLGGGCSIGPRVPAGALAPLIALLWLARLAGRRRR